MKSLLFVIMALGALLMAGCATKPKPAFNDVRTIYVEPVVPHEVKNRIGEANRMFDNGEYREAMRLYDEVLEDYSSDDVELECAVHTNQALAALATGDRELFLQYADQVHGDCINVKHPSENTRWVLVLRQAFRNEPSRDLRVSQGLHSAVFRVLRGKE